ncbi:GlxA family transcriptional regulator [Shinella daejeonensis]|uniref:GlxA family transcriptional regulator n=1 Tax=Shinella daejeonensis TaxID=659017 RepID=UPI0020C7BAB8|nr:GlxA family transcriptional regulator [Shinella daejeonensis]MCP8895129.1 GlxA family transcriptional regulator [Shinella daejeonensis]
MNDVSDVVFLLVEDFSHLAFACALEPLRIANFVADRELYRWRLASADGRSAICSNRAVTLVDQDLTPLERGEALFLISGINVQHHVTPRLLSYLRTERVRGVPIGAICSGAYVLAEAGLLDGRRAAVHWQYHDLFKERFPFVNLTKSVFVADEKFVTASGGAAAADLMLHRIARDHGRDLAAAVADQMVYSGAREASATQRVSARAKYGIRNNRLAQAIGLIEESLETPFSSYELSKRLGISTRQLERLFSRYLNTTPKRYILEARLHRARNLIMQSEQAITEIAMACGFTSTSHFSRVYRDHFGKSPVNQRSVLN